MPVRKVSGRGRNMIGLFPSLKLGRMVAFESLIEQDYLYVLDYETEVTWFEEQPLTISYAWQEKSYEYTPDFHVTRPTGHELVECKPTVFVQKTENQRKFAAAQEWCQQQGWSFSIVTDQALRKGYRLANIKLLTRYARFKLSPELLEQAQAYLQNKTGPIPLLEAGRYLVPEHPAQGMAALFHMAFYQRIGIDLDDHAITEQDLIWSMKEPTG